MEFQKSLLIRPKLVVAFGSGETVLRYLDPMIHNINSFGKEQHCIAEIFGARADAQNLL